MRTTALAAAAALLALVIATTSLAVQTHDRLTGDTCAPPTTRLDGEMYESQQALEQWVKAQAATFKRPALASYQATYSPPELQALNSATVRPDRLSLDVTVLDEGVLDPVFGMVMDFKEAQTFRVVLERDCGDDWFVASALRTGTESGRPVGMGSPGFPVDG